MSNPKINDSVIILNRTMSGKFIYEGTATVVSEEKYNQLYDVEFEKGEIVTRFIDMEVQGLDGMKKVNQYLKKLNKLINREKEE
jgi:uncharacterized protein with ACT and thioredoxin-like domain|tara:strand:+ start:448 stop:699 length:252 start_codon:yes stop_codon:yes gene_type:complete